jgi:hypothetical protein
MCSARRAVGKINYVHDLRGVGPKIRPDVLNCIRPRNRPLVIRLELGDTGSLTFI